MPKLYLKNFIDIKDTIIYISSVLIGFNNDFLFLEFLYGASIAKIVCVLFRFFQDIIHCEKDWVTLENLRKKVGGFVTF